MCMKQLRSWSSKYTTEILKQIKINYLIHLLAIILDQSSVSLKQYTIDSNKVHQNQASCVFNATIFKAQQIIVFIEAVMTVGERKYNSLKLIFLILKHYCSLKTYL